MVPVSRCSHAPQSRRREYGGEVEWRSTGRDTIHIEERDRLNATSREVAAGAAVAAVGGALIVAVATLSVPAGADDSRETGAGQRSSLSVQEFMLTVSENHANLNAILGVEEVELVSLDESTGEITVGVRDRISSHEVHLLGHTVTVVGDVPAVILQGPGQP